MKNSLADLNNHLFAQLERLGDEDITDEDLNKEIQRAEVIKGVATKIIENAQVVLKAEKMRVDLQIEDEDTTKFLTGRKREKLING